MKLTQSDVEKIKEEIEPVSYTHLFILQYIGITIASIMYAMALRCV